MKFELSNFRHDFLASCCEQRASLPAASNDKLITPKRIHVNPEVHWWLKLKIVYVQVSSDEDKQNQTFTEDIKGLRDLCGFVTEYLMLQSVEIPLTRSATVFLLFVNLLFSPRWQTQLTILSTAICSLKGYEIVCKYVDAHNKGTKVIKSISLQRKDKLCNFPPRAGKSFAEFKCWHYGIVGGGGSERSVKIAGECADVAYT